MAKYDWSRRISIIRMYSSDNKIKLTHHSGVVVNLLTYGPQVSTKETGFRSMSRL